MAINRSPLPPAEVLWRPGCPFCVSLRRGLLRAGVTTVEHDIWASPDAAARVRAVTGGDETVPTVIVGTRSLVNPSVRQVVRALEAEYPGHEQPSSAAGGAGPARVRGGTDGLLWTAVVTLVWMILAVWQPSTTWHLAPMLIAAAWPWMVGQDQSPSDPSSRRRVVTAGGASARVGTRAFAKSDDVVNVEGNAYFPVDSVPDGVLRPSGTTSVCPWKGVASYYDVHLDGQVIPDGAWTYRHPFPLARRVKGRVAFWNGIDVDRS